MFDIIKGEGATCLMQEIRLFIKSENNPSFFVNYAYKIVDENFAWFVVEVNSEMKTYLQEHFTQFSRSLYLRSLDRKLAKNPDFRCSFFFVTDTSQCLKATYKLSPQPMGTDDLVSQDLITLDEGFWKLFKLLKT